METTLEVVIREASWKRGTPSWYLDEENQPCPDLGTGTPSRRNKMSVLQGQWGSQYRRGPAHQGGSGGNDRKKDRSHIAWGLLELQGCFLLQQQEAQLDTVSQNASATVARTSTLQRVLSLAPQGIFTSSTLSFVRWPLAGKKTNNWVSSNFQRMSS